MVRSRLDDLIDKLKAFSEQKVDDGLLAIVKKHSAQIVDLNIDQLMHGENAEGGLLGTYKSEPYARFKRTLNPLGVLDLRLTGDFQNGFFLEADAFPVTVFSRDNKTPKLTAFYDNIFGFTVKSKNEIVQDVRPEAQELVQGMLQV